VVSWIRRFVAALSGSAFRSTNGPVSVLYSVTVTGSIVVLPFPETLIWTHAGWVQSRVVAKLGLS
jgi:hypothetical protein